jgi:hypothetical protein
MMKLHAICCAALTIAATSCFPTPAQAESIPAAVDRAMFDQTGDTFQNTGIDRQFTMLFGLSYSDNNGVNDARAVDNIYRDLLRQRAGVPIRTADLPDPFSSSLLTNPARVNTSN